MDPKVCVLCGRAKPEDRISACRTCISDADVAKAEHLLRVQGRQVLQRHTDELERLGEPNPKVSAALNALRAVHTAGSLEFEAAEVLEREIIRLNMLCN